MIGRNGYSALQIRIDDGVALLTMPMISEDDTLARRLHVEIGTVWRLLDGDPGVRAVLVTGTGDEFYASGGSGKNGSMDVLRSGDMDMRWTAAMRAEREIRDLVYEMINFSKPVVSAINGEATGAGMAVALLADISVAADDARLWDPHTDLGLAAGDGATLIWPLVASLAKTKLHLLTSEPVDGAEAERIGLVGRSVPRKDLMSTAGAYAAKLAAAPPSILRFTKKSLNQWLRFAGIVSYDYSLALEMLSFFGPGVRGEEGPPGGVVDAES